MEDKTTVDALLDRSGVARAPSLTTDAATRGLGDIPLHLVLDLVVAGIELGIAAAELEHEILTEADVHRSGGTWQLHIGTAVEIAGRDATCDDGEWRWSVDGDPIDANVVAQGGFARALFTAERTPVGPSVGQRSVDFWRFADAEWGTSVGPLTAPVDVRSSGRQRSSTRP